MDGVGRGGSDVLCKSVDDGREWIFCGGRNFEKVDGARIRERQAFGQVEAVTEWC